MTISDCSCCTCERTSNNVDAIYKIDPACRNHGAHGLRECRRHKSPAEPCRYNDGCGMTIDRIIDLEH